MPRSILSLFLIAICLSAFSAARDEPFEQEIATQYAYDSLGIELPVSGLAYGPGSNLWIAASNGLFRLQNGAAQRFDDRLGVAWQPGMRIVSYAGPSGALVAAGADGYWILAGSARPAFREAGFGAAHDISISPSGDLWFATDNGLFTLRRGSRELQRIDEIDGAVLHVAAGPEGLVSAATEDKLWRYDGRGWFWEWLAMQIGPPVGALAYNTQHLCFIGNDECLHIQAPSGALTRVDGYDGLPYNHINDIAALNDNVVWFATGRGVMRLKNAEWSYYAGPRWQLGEAASHIAVAPDGSAAFADELGVNFILMDQWTLKRKADYFAGQVYPRHDRHGLVAGVRLAEPGDLDSYVQRSDDNDGLWTAMYLASLCFQYAVTEDEAVKELAWKHFAAMERLETITGMPGFPARSFLKREDYDPSIGGEWHVTPDGEWAWKGDTSSDEIVGHMFAYPLMYDLVASTTDEKRRVGSLIERIMGRIVDDGFYLVDKDGEPTRWGVWAPEKLNDDPEWMMERGLNSLQILSFLCAADHVSGNPRFRTALFNLITRHNYAHNTINQKITLPYEDNHSDDELAFLPYYILFRYNIAERYEEIYRESLTRAWQHMEPKKPALWNIIASVCLGEAKGIDDALWTLRNWPLDQIDWPVPALHRLDVIHHRYPDRFDQTQLATLLPPDERRIQRWNGNPYRVDGGSGAAALDPAAWLLPYWMARYHGLF